VLLNSTFLVSRARDKTQTHNIYSVTIMQIAKRVRRSTLEIKKRIIENYSSDHL